MDEKTFIKLLLGRYIARGFIVIRICYSLDDNGNVMIDKDSILEEYNSKLDGLLEATNDITRT
jgi:hypothetical protein